MSGPGKRHEKRDDDRATRLAEALRENLRKRKSQARGRKRAASGTDEAASAGDGRDKQDDTSSPGD